MIKTELTKKAFFENDVEAYVIFMSENLEPTVDLSKVEKEYPQVKSILKKHKFKGKTGQSFAFTYKKNNDLKHFIFVGTGKKEETSPAGMRPLENLRRAIGSSILKLKSLEIGSAVIAIPEGRIYGVEELELLKQTVIISHMASYEFENFKSETKKKWACNILLAFNGDGSKALEEGIIIANAVNDSRLLCDMPPNIATPTYVSDYAKKIATDIEGLKCAVFDRKKAEEFEMGGFLAVDFGSEQEGRFVVLEYESQDSPKDSPTICLVGKGVTFDSGGISLKPASAMTGMKFDMSGAAAVIGAMQAISQLKPKVNVVGITPLVENMPSGRANRQDDIVKFMNGKTAEIINTDAEGRLILADALCYAEKIYKPDVIIDIATLTGACLYALGHSYTALMTKDEKLSALLISSGEITGDKVWPLPFDDDFKGAIKSKVADIANCGTPKYKAGTITAGFFLSKFVEKTPWVHLDIAGTADSVPCVNYLGSGATGVGVRLFVDFVMKYKK
jgi:leucyl aminopeptidase